MQALQTATKWIITTIVALTVTLAEFGKELVKEPVEALMGSEDYATAAAFALVFALVWSLIQLLQEILPWLVQNNVWLRRMLLRKDFIEGTWKDVVRRDCDELNATGGIVQITYSDGGLKVSGETFDAAGNPIGNFNSLVTHYDKGELVYCFSKYVSRSGERPVSPGYCLYRFSTALGQPRPHSFYGYFFKEDDNAMYRVDCWRLTKADEDAVRRGPESTASLVQELIATRPPAGAAVIHRDEPGKARFEAQPVNRRQIPPVS